MRHDQRHCQGQPRSDGKQPSAPLRRHGCDGLRRPAAVGRRAPPAPLARSPSGPAQTPALVREHNCDACTPDAQSSSTCPAARPSKRGNGCKGRLRGKSKSKEAQPHWLATLHQTFKSTVVREGWKRWKRSGSLRMASQAYGLQLAGIGGWRTSPSFNAANSSAVQYTRYSFGAHRRDVTCT